MKLSLVLIVLAAGATKAGERPSPTLPSGDYTFEHRFAEHPTIPSVALVARIDAGHITLVNEDASGVFDVGVVAEGTLMWHARSGRWIIAQQPSDREAIEVGGCSDGPEVIDLQQRIYWTC